MLQRVKNQTTRALSASHDNPYERVVNFNSANSPRFDPKNQKYHYASNIQIIYSPFRKDVYIPPHLNSSQSVNVLRKSECKNWQINQSYRKNAQGRCIAGKQVNFSEEYTKMENRIQKKGRKAGKLIKNSWNTFSKIKYLLDEDRQLYRMTKNPRKLCYLDEDEQ